MEHGITKTASISLIQFNAREILTQFVQVEDAITIQVEMAKCLGERQKLYVLSRIR